MMKSQQQQSTMVALQTFKTIPVVRLDSGAVRIPVEFLDALEVPRNKRGQILRITVSRPGSFCAWR